MKHVAGENHNETCTLHRSQDFTEGSACDFVAEDVPTSRNEPAAGYNTAPGTLFSKKNGHLYLQ